MKQVFKIFQKIPVFIYVGVISPRKGSHIFMNYDTIKFIDGDFEMDVNVSPEDNNVWLSKDEMAILFNKGRPTIIKQINSIYSKEELERRGMCIKMEHMVPNLNRVYTSSYYNLEVIMSVALRLKSNRGTMLKEQLNNYLTRLYNQEESNEIIIYNNGSLNIAVKISPEEDTVWLTVKQISELFDTTTNNVYTHIKNIIEEGELDIDRCGKDSLLDLPFQKKSSVIINDGRTYQIDSYNLDMILAIGYRVKSKNAIMFRRWVTNILKQYMLKGYALNSNRISISIDNFIQLENDISHMKDEIKEIKQRTFIEPKKDKIIDEGETYDAHEYLTKLFSKASKSVVIIDPYFDISGLNYLRLLNKDIEKIVILSKKSSISDVDISLFINQYGPLTIVKYNNFHDRYLIIDKETIYSLGSSLNQVGQKIYSMHKIEDDIDFFNNKVKMLLEI